MKHNFKLIPKEKIIMGGPMNVFIRCNNKGCIAGMDWATSEDPKILLQQVQKEAIPNCSYFPSFGRRINVNSN